nr:hypothetical protein [Moritella viscosa]SHN97599.1 Putative uncharacterized protein [Moritella viscosa]
MIKIDLRNKLSSQKMSLNAFYSKYVEIVENENYSLVMSKNGVYNDKFFLFTGESQLQLSKRKSEKLKTPELFISMYNTNIDLKVFIDSIFSPIKNIQQAKVILREILLMSPDDLKINCELKNTNKNLNDRIYSLFNYDKHGSYKKRQSSSLRDLFSSLNFKVCIYCNRNYTSNFLDGEKNRPTFTLDHFYQKEKHPLFALSLFNLIPCCSVCNTTIKGTKILEHYDNPYSSKYDFHQLASFKLRPFFEVDLVSNDSKCRDYIKDFKLNEIYKCHTQEVEEFVIRRQIFNDKIISKLSDITKESTDNIKASLFGSYKSTTNMGNESLSKLKIDLAKQLLIT